MLWRVTIAKICVVADDVRLRDAVRRGVKHHNHLISSLHLNGINVRYLKCVVDHTSTSSTRQLIGVHMIARQVFRSFPCEIWHSRLSHHF